MSIHCRVSSHAQGQFGKNVSLEQQEEACRKYACDKKIKIVSINKSIQSARNGINSLISASIEQTRYKNFIFYSVDRMSRSSKSLNFLKSIKIKTTLHFVRENFTYPPNNVKLKYYLSEAEKESNLISKRIKDVFEYEKNAGVTRRKIAPFGYNITRQGHKNVLTENKTEMATLRFIMFCKENKNIMADEVNDLLSLVWVANGNIKSKFESVIFLDNQWMQINKKDEFSNKCVAELLNEYTIKHRQRRWTTKHIKSAKFFSTARPLKRNVSRSRSKSPAKNARSRSRERSSNSSALKIKPDNILQPPSSRPQYNQMRCQMPQYNLPQYNQMLCQMPQYNQMLCQIPQYDQMRCQMPQYDQMQHLQYQMYQMQSRFNQMQFQNASLKNDDNHK
jgi:hypothetical protein